MPNNQSWFEDNRLLSLCMGLNHPQKLFLMQDCCSKTIWENTSCSDWTLDGEPLGLSDVCLHLQKKIWYTVVIRKRKNDSSKIANWINSDAECIFFFSFHFSKKKKINVCVANDALVSSLWTVVALHETKVALVASFSVHSKPLWSTNIKILTVLNFSFSSTFSFFHSCMPFYFIL